MMARMVVAALVGIIVFGLAWFGSVDSADLATGHGLDATWHSNLLRLTEPFRHVPCEKSGFKNLAEHGFPPHGALNGEKRLATRGADHLQEFAAVKRIGETREFLTLPSGVNRPSIFQWSGRIERNVARFFGLVRNNLCIAFGFDPANRCETGIDDFHLNARVERICLKPNALDCKISAVLCAAHCASNFVSFLGCFERFLGIGKGSSVRGNFNQKGFSGFLSLEFASFPQFVGGLPERVSEPRDGKSGQGGDASGVSIQEHPAFNDEIDRHLISGAIFVIGVLAGITYWIVKR